MGRYAESLAVVSLRGWFECLVGGGSILAALGLFAGTSGYMAHENLCLWKLTGVDCVGGLHGRKDVSMKGSCGRIVCGRTVTHPLWTYCLYG